MRKIIKKVGGDRIGSGGKMTVAAHGYGYSTHDVSKVRRTSMSFGTLVPMGMWLMTAGSRLSGNLDALITSNALLYQLYGSAKFQLDVFSARVALYNPKMLLNLNDQGYEVGDIKFPQMTLTTYGLENDKVRELPIDWRQVNPSSLLSMLGISGNGQRSDSQYADVIRDHMAMWLLMYYQVGKEYYANKQEGIGMMIHNVAIVENVLMLQGILANGTDTLIQKYGSSEGSSWLVGNDSHIKVTFDGPVSVEDRKKKANEILLSHIKPGNEEIEYTTLGTIVSRVETENTNVAYYYIDNKYVNLYILGWTYTNIQRSEPQLVPFDLKAIDRMAMKILKNVDSSNPLMINENNELPYGASFQGDDDWRSINTSQEGLLIGTYQSDVFNNWLDNATINALNGKTKVKVDANGEFSIDTLNLTQKLYNYDQRIGITDGTLDEWRELTYAQVGKSKSLKPVYEGGLSKEIVFDMVVSTADTEENPLGSIASRGQFGSKHKGGYIQIDSDEEKLVMVIAKITPRLVYSQGNDWTNNLKSLDDLHKPALDKIGYQNLLSDQSAVMETIVAYPSKVLTTKSIGKQPAWQWYRTAYDDVKANMAYEESYKVFGREYSYIKNNGLYEVQDQTTYINPKKFNDVFAIESLDAMNFDVQVGMDFKLTLVMSEEVIPNL